MPAPITTPQALHRSFNRLPLRLRYDLIASLTAVSTGPSYGGRGIGGFGGVNSGDVDDAMFTRAVGGLVNAVAAKFH